MTRPFAKLFSELTKPNCMKKLLLTLVTLASLHLNAARAAEGDKFKVSEFSFTRPAKWESVQPASSMRAAQLKVPDAKFPEGAEVVFFYFGEGGGGGTQANVTRWFGQFAEPREEIKAKTEETTIGKTKVTYVQAQGTYKSGPPGGAVKLLKDYALRGAVIEGEQGAVFVKLTGPVAVTEAATADFKKMVESGVK